MVNKYKLYKYSFNKKHKTKSILNFVGLWWHILRKSKELTGVLQHSMIDHDMDQVIKNGLTTIFSRAKRLACLQHMSEFDSKKVEKLFASTPDKKRLLSDIYESKKDGLQFGLVDAIDVFEFNVKLEKVKLCEIVLCLGFIHGL